MQAQAHISGCHDRCLKVPVICSAHPSRGYDGDSERKKRHSVMELDIFKNMGDKITFGSVIEAGFSVDECPWFATSHAFRRLTTLVAWKNSNFGPR